MSWPINFSIASGIGKVEPAFPPCVGHRWNLHAGHCQDDSCFSND